MVVSENLHFFFFSASGVITLRMRRGKKKGCLEGCLYFLAVTLNQSRIAAQERARCQGPKLLICLLSCSRLYALNNSICNNEGGP